MIKNLKLIDWILEILGLIGIILIIYFVIVTYPVLPDIIAKHWDYRGIADEYGSKEHFFAMPIFALIIYVGFSIMLPYSRAKTFKNVSSDSIRIQYLNFFRLFRLLKIVLIGLFLHTVYIHSMGFLNKEPIIGDVSPFVDMALILFFTGIILYKGMKMKTTANIS